MSLIKTVWYPGLPASEANILPAEEILLTLSNYIYLEGGAEAGAGVVYCRV
jgi:hypothetical protein